MLKSMGRSLVAGCVLVALLVVALGSGAAAGRGNPKGTAFNIGFETFEPTIAATANGNLYFSITPTSGVAVGWDASIAKSEDGGESWTDVGPRTVGDRSMPPETNDPYIYADPATGRIFTFHMSPILTCSIMSWSDDGGESWQTNPHGCSPTVIWDHQTMVAAKPRGTETNGYPNILHQCVNAVYAAMCATSTDGGATWGPSVPAYVNENVTSNCGAQHGHLAAGPDGQVYLPTSFCGTNPMVYVSDDDGLSWRKSVIADVDTPFVDPTVSVDSKGNLYAAFIDEAGWLYFASSRDNAKSWSKPIPVAEGYTANMPVIVAGDPGKVAIAYPGTDDLVKGYGTKGYIEEPDPQLLKKVAWGANYTVSTNALSPHPSFSTVVATGSDPIGRGRMCVRATRCDYLIDFIEAVIGSDGRPYASFVDGCLDACATSQDGAQLAGTGVGVLTTLTSGPRLCATLCWRYKSSSKNANLPDVVAYALGAQPQEAALDHATLSPREQSLMDAATRQRIRAVRP